MSLLDRPNRGVAKSAFTLLELLGGRFRHRSRCLALLLPAVQMGAEQSARRMTCQSNLHQWSIALQRFADISNGYLPRRGQGVQGVQVTNPELDRPEDWFNALPPLLESQPYSTLTAVGHAASTTKFQRVDLP